MKVRLVHDLRRLKEIQSIARKIDAKREMLPEYWPWVEGLIAAGAPSAGDEVLPTIMVWMIDIGEYEVALPLICHVLKHNIPLPSRYERSAPALIVEEVAEGALKLQQAGSAAPLALLEEIEALTSAYDMHDEIRAKIHKAIGVELLERAIDLDMSDPRLGATIERAHAELTRAQALHGRVGVKDKLQRLDRLVKSIEQGSTPPSPPRKPAPRAKAPARKSPPKKETTA